MTNIKDEFQIQFGANFWNKFCKNVNESVVKKASKHLKYHGIVYTNNPIWPIIQAIENYQK